MKVFIEVYIDKRSVFIIVYFKETKSASILIKKSVEFFPSSRSQLKRYVAAVVILITDGPVFNGAATFTLMTLSIMTVSMTTLHNDTQHDDFQDVKTQYNDTQHNESQHGDTQHNDFQHYDSHHYGFQHNNAPQRHSAL
jgi:hypothetical protein